MATFKVGQRVRIVRVQYYPEDCRFIGQEGTIVPKAGVAADLKSYEYHVACALGAIALNGHHLEPIQPERNRVVAWEDCPIDPRKIAELV